MRKDSFWAVQVLDRPSNGWAPVPENGWGLLVAASIIQEGFAGQVARTAFTEVRTGVIEDERGRRSFDLSPKDISDIGEFINDYLVDAGAPANPVVAHHHWWINPPEGMQLDDFWNRYDRLWFRGDVSNHPSTLYKPMRALSRELYGT